ncbi:MAG: metal ABC transporter permease [Candidatus Cloacimonetes bacterium]|nr:metal ABC transporter permease [Candidatus Cloacimonadota bacterium]NLO11053.1 metal ABC transporter permease [Candidatus Cloacimonadota bacterium]
MLYFFLIRALLGAILSSVSLALFSPFVTLRRVSYLGEALSHIAFAGIAIAFVLGLHTQAVTLVFVMAVALAIGRLSQKYKLEEANTITIFLSVSMALGIILISLRKVYTFDLASYLFGNVLMVSTSDLIVLGVLCLLSLGFIIFFFKELFYLSYNFEMAGFYRVPVSLVNHLFLAMLAANIVINLKAAGIILVSAQLILPASTAFNLSRKLPSMIAVSAIVAAVAAVGGFAMSWWLDLPTGAAIVVLEFILFLISLLLRPKQ